MKRKLLILLVIMSACLHASAQFDVHFSNYTLLKGYYNPSYTAVNRRINIMGTYSMQLLGYEGAPQSMYFGGDIPFRLFGKNQGAGIGFFNETIGMFKTQNFWGQYSFQQAIGKGFLCAGVRVGGLTVGFDPTDIVFGDEGVDDPAFPTSEVDGMTFDLAAGLFYEHPWFWVGASASHLTFPSIEMGDVSNFEVSPVLYFMGGGNIKTKNPLITIQPSFMLETDFVAYRCDISLKMTYSHNEKDFFGGVTYSPMTSVGFTFGTVIKDFTIGYTYDMFTGKVGLAAGNHDIFLSYSLDMIFSKKSKNKHKSIRIL